MISGSSATTTDRLTNLPESIIQHILSFLDTKSSIQTSLLSRPWRSLWKHVLALNLNRSSSPNPSSFNNFIDKFLSLRNQNPNLRKISYNEDDDDTLDGEDDSSTVDLIFNYATVHGVDEFSMNCKHRNYPQLLSLITDSNMETLRLSRSRIDGAGIGIGSALGFPVLTSLVLDFCRFTRHHPDPFAEFPCLKKLELNGPLVPPHTSLKISGPQLLTLKLVIYDCGKFTTEINAPKLESFSLNVYAEEVEHIPEFAEVNLPALVHASLMFTKLELANLMNIFGIVRNVRFLRINSVIVKSLEYDPKFLQQQQHSSPFRRLEKLIAGCNISVELADFFFQSSHQWRCL
ncbi:FBD-associated F-box protein At5g18780 [Linum perenne]